MKHPQHELDEDVVREIVTRLLEYSTSRGMDICAHYFEAAVWGLVATSALDLAEGDPLEAANIVQRNAGRALKILRDPGIDVIQVVSDGRRLQ